jgi:ferric-dicitrate binding protein FerR (iron transport regulator)
MKPEYFKIVPQWRKRKEDIWMDVFAGLDENSGQSVKNHSIRLVSFWKYAAAILIVLLLTGIITAHQYTVTVTAERGMHRTICLPDQSVVSLNAESKLSYHPYWWFVTRNVRLQGEACFEVKAGKRFSVISDKNAVNVLGTTFDVFARPEMYRVTCLTGKVEVLVNQEKVLLTPMMQVTCRKGKLIVKDAVSSNQSTAWMQDKLVFTGAPLAEVIAEIERQYDIRITADVDLEFIYTGHFSKTKNPEEVLEIIGKPFGISFKIN